MPSSPGRYSPVRLCLVTWGLWTTMDSQAMWFLLGDMISALPLGGLQRGWRLRSATGTVNHVSTIKTLGTMLGWASLASSIPHILLHIIARKVRTLHDSIVDFRVWSPPGLCPWLVLINILYSFPVITQRHDSYSFQ